MRPKLDGYRKKIVETFQVKIEINPKRNEQQSEQNKDGIG